MRYAAIQENDFINGEGVCVSFWTQGCPHRCPGCHNPETWNFEGGQPLPNDYRGHIIKAISANGITRNFSVLGGEPLCPENLALTHEVISAVRSAYPHIKIFLWTGYYLKDLEINTTLEDILAKVDIIIEGPFILQERDTTLKFCGSRNQNILTKGIDF